MAKSTHKLLPMMGIFILLIVLTGVNGKLYTPLIAENVKFDTVWDFADACDQKGATLPEITTASDVSSFTRELSNLLNTNLLGKRYYTGVSRWSDVQKGIEDRYGYVDPENGKSLPSSDNQLWAKGSPDNGDGKTQFFLSMWTSLLALGIPVGPVGLNEAQTRDPDTILACTKTGPRRACPAPLVRRTHNFAVWVNGVEQQDPNGTYPFGTTATYSCPPGYVFAHNTSVSSMRVKCYGGLGWGPDFPLNTSCVPVAALTVDTLGEQIHAVFPYNVPECPDCAPTAKKSIWEADKFCADSTKSNDAVPTSQNQSFSYFGLPLLPLSGNLPYTGSLFGANFDASFLAILDFHARDYGDVFIGTNIRAGFDPNATLPTQYSYVRSAWTAIATNVNRPLLDRLPDEPGTETKLCAVYSFDQTMGNPGIKPVPCNSQYTPTKIICHSGTAACDAEDLPVFLKNELVKVSYSTSPVTGIGYPTGTNATYSCASGAEFEQSPTESTTFQCMGSLGWDPLAGSAKCIPVTTTTAPTTPTVSTMSSATTSLTTSSLPTASSTTSSTTSLSSTTSPLTTSSSTTSSTTMASSSVASSGNASSLPTGTASTSFTTPVLGSGAINVVSFETNFAGTILSAVESCAATGTGVSLVSLSSKSDFSNLAAFLNTSGFQGVLPLANNILSARSQSATGLTNAELSGAWTVAFGFNESATWNPGFPVYNATKLGLCSVMRKRQTSPTTWGLENWPCDAPLVASEILCQSSSGVCSSVILIGPNMTVTVEGTGTDASGFTGSSYPDGTIAHIGCKFGHLYKGVDNSRKHPDLTCYGGLGWYPRVSGGCTPGTTKICELNRKRYTILKIPDQRTSVVELAFDCYYGYSGSAVEVRNGTATLATLRTLNQQLGCESPTFVFVAPTAWDNKELAFSTPIQQLTTEIFQKIWRYQSDGTSLVRASIFDQSQPDSGPQAGTSMHMLPFAGYTAGTDDPPSYASGFMCEVNTTEEFKSCSSLPRNPTNGSSNAATLQVLPPASPDGPYPFGTVVAFVCPCGYEWAASGPGVWANPARPRPGNSTVIEVTCLGSAGWTTYDVPNVCESRTRNPVELQYGKLHLIIEEFSGNILDAARACARKGMGMPVFESSSDASKWMTALDAFSSCGDHGDIPLAKNIMAYLTPSKVLNETAFKEAWNLVFPADLRFWHEGEPFYHPLKVAGCSVVTWRDSKWRVATRSCSAVFSTSMYMCYNKTSPPITTVCATSDLNMLQGTTASFSSNYSINATEVAFGTVAVKSCPCGTVFKDTRNTSTVAVRRQCFGYTMGWIPEVIAECVQAPTIVEHLGFVFSTNKSSGSNVSYGITEASKLCYGSSGQRGSIAEITTTEQLNKLAVLMHANCLKSAFVAPTAWRNEAAAMQYANTTLSATTIGNVWVYSNGTMLPYNLPFSPGDPNNSGGRENCLEVTLTNSTDPGVIGISDSQCWSATDKTGAYICSVPNAANPAELTSCGPPSNPTTSKTVQARMEYLSPNSAGSSKFSYGSVVDYICPDGYSWVVPPWPTFPALNASLIRTKVSVRCLGTLDWTLYDVSECSPATVCGPLPPTPDWVVQNCSVVNATNGNQTYECTHTCKNPTLFWKSGRTVQNLTCDIVKKTWSAYNDTCSPASCNASMIRNLTGVLLNWDGTVTAGSVASYSCPQDKSFFGSSAKENTTIDMKCLGQNNWSTVVSADLVCLPLRCNIYSLPMPVGALYQLPANSSINSNVTYSCPDGFAFGGNASASNLTYKSTCLGNGTWSALPQNLTCLSTTCNVTRIPDPAGVLHVQPNGTTLAVGSNITYYCPDGFAFLGKLTNPNFTYQSTCLANVSWSLLPANATCVSTSCNVSLIPNPPGVSRLLPSSGNTRIGSVVEYTCPAASAFGGNVSAINETQKITCQAENATWSSLPNGTSCELLSCDPTMIQNFTGVLQQLDGNSTFVGSRVTYFCPDGYAFDGNASAVGTKIVSECQPSVTWSPIPGNLNCVAVMCNASMVKNITGFEMTWNGDTNIGSVVVYACPQGRHVDTTGNSTGPGPTMASSPTSMTSVCQPDTTWSPVPANAACVEATGCDPTTLETHNETGTYEGMQTSGNYAIGDAVYLLYTNHSAEWMCVTGGLWTVTLYPKWFPERIPVPTLPSYPVDFVETTLYHWGRAVENATCTGCLTGNISAPIESPGPTQFGQGVEIRGWDNECLEDNDFERRANFTCFANPMTCANGSNGISMGFFYKRGIPMKDVYLVYFNPKNSSANYPTKETLVSSGGDREGHPGIHVWWEGPFLGVLVSTGELYWEVLFLPKLFNDTWNNIGFRWFRPTPGVDDDGRLEVLINVEQQAATNQAKRASRVQSMLLPPTMLMGCHKDSTNTQKRFYGEGFFDEVAFWDTFIFDNTSRMFAGGYLPELNGVPTSVILDSIRESAKLEDERTRQVAWIAVQSIASDTNMTSEPVRPADAALNKTGETPSQQVENLVKFVTTLQSAEYISSSNSIGAVAKAARTSMSATSTLLSGNRHAWEEIADAGYKPGAYALVKSQNDYFMNMADSIAVDTKMTSAQMIDVTSDEIVSKLGVARIGHLRQSPTLKFPNYEDEIWGNGSMSKKFDYPVDTIEVPLGLYFPSSKTCDGTNLVNIEMNAYKNLDDFMPPNKVNPLKIVSQDNVIDSNILYFAFTLNKNIPKAKVAGCQPDALAMISNPIKLLFRHKMDEPAQEAGFKSRKLKFHTEEVEYNIKVRRCVWWNPSMNEFGGWDPSGCNIYDTADNFTMCECAAQGLFGILGEMIQHYELPTEPTWLTVVKFVGYGLSILCLPLFIVIVLKSKDHLHDQFHIMRANLAFALLVGLILHCISDLHSIRDSRHACTAISVMFHYFYTAAGAWFCFESYASFVAITQGIIGGKLRAYIPLCWGLPFLSVGAALIQDMLSYGTDPRCMISFDNEMKWIFFGPLLTFASIGFLLSAIVICNISTPALRKDHIADELVSVGQGLAAQVTYFLCTWIAGVCAYFIYDWTIETPGFYALFQVLNAYTGVFYLVFMGFISLRFRMVVLGVAQKRKLMILQYLTRNQHEQLKPTPSVDNQQSDELPDELFAEGGPSSGRRKILTST